jgi:hypothetical protein
MDVEAVPVSETDYDAFRNRYLKHEASIRSMGFLYLIPGVLLVLIAAVFAILAI